MNIIFMGRKKYSAELLEWTLSQGINIEAVVTDSHLPDSLTAAKAEELNIPVISIEEAEEKLKHSIHNVDLVISYLFWKKIKEPLISSPNYGCINFHPALLPDWRGVAGYNIAILNRLNEWGSTAHFVDSEIDTGNIIRRYKFNFDYRIETAQTLEKKTQEIQMDLYKSVILDLLADGKLESIKQEKQEGTYITKAQMEDMKKINCDTDEDIDLKIRAFWFPPHDGAHIELNNKKYTLVNKFILEQINNLGE